MISFIHVPSYLISIMILRMILFDITPVKVLVLAANHSSHIVSHVYGLLSFEHGDYEVETYSGTSV
jgi:hypothetical protein